REDLRLFEEGQNVGVFDEVVLDRLGGRLSFLRIGFGGQSVEEFVDLRVDRIVVGIGAAGAVEEDIAVDRGVVRAQIVEVGAGDQRMADLHGVEIEASSVCFDWSPGLIDRRTPTRRSCCWIRVWTSFDRGWGRAMFTVSASTCPSLTR